MVCPNNRSFLALTLCVLLSSSCSDQGRVLAPELTEAKQKRSLDFKTCERTSTTQSAGLVSESKCLIFERAENPADPDGRQIPLQVMVIPSLKSNSLADPLLILAGGPGQAATEMASLGLIFGKIRQDRDIVLLDQRGTGKLSPMRCSTTPDQISDLSLDNLLQVQTDLLNTCLLEMDASPQYYTTDIAIQDLEALRKYLGYEKFNLWGASYGTRVALAFLQAYPNSVRTTVIDGVAPSSMSLPLYIERDASRALDMIFEDCAAEPACSVHFPKLRQHFDELGKNLTTQQTLSLQDPVSNEPVTLSVDVDWLHASLRSPLYSRVAQRLVPFIIEQAYEGNFAPLLSVSAIEGDLNEAMFLSVVCSEDVAQISPFEMSQERAKPYTLKSRHLNIPILEACKQWPKRALDKAYFEPTISDKPVLIFSGASDPVTPPSWGDSVMLGLSNSRHLVVEGFAHNTLGSNCTIDIITDFINTADSTKLDATCLSNIKRRPFYVGTGGSTSDD
jgi:pimeloyl-ACP methyl ester carboxylesterase